MDEIKQLLVLIRMDHQNILKLRFNSAMKLIIPLV
jgi:hypothetical protein